MIQHKLPELIPAQESGADEGKCKNGWYNKASGVPNIRFVYPEYDTGIISKEYGAPVTIHYTLSASEISTNNNSYNTYNNIDNDIDNDIDNNTNITTGLILENSITKGVLNSYDTYCNSSGKNIFKLTEDNPADYVIDFEYDKATGYAKDSIYTLTYWMTDKFSS